MGDPATLGLYMLYFILAVFTVMLYFTVRQSMKRVESMLSSFTGALADRIAYNVAKDVAEKTGVNRLAKTVERAHREYLYNVLEETRKYARELASLREDLYNSLNAVRDAVARLEYELRELSNETIAWKVAAALNRNIRETERLIERLGGLAARLEALQKTLDSKIEGYYGSILSQISDVRRYVMDVRREARRCFRSEVKDDGGGEEA